MRPRPLNVFIIAAVVSLGLPSMLNAALTMETPFTDNMVLQRNMKVPVWGRAVANEAVTVRLNGQTKKATADLDGKWMVRFDPMPAGGPFTLTVKDSGNTVTLKDVLVGEVWMCTGQSNMRQPLGNFPGYHPGEEAVGLGQVRMVILGKEKEDWKVCDPATVESFSAVGFFFGRELYRSLDIPIGLIQTAIGGTSLESWMSPAGVDECPDLVWGQQFPGGNPVGGNFKYLEPSIPFGIRGAIWYQGENNGNRDTTETYRDHFAALIKGWRQSWGQGDFPFLFVQLANFRELQTQPDPSDSWAMIREAQRLTLSQPATGMASAIDIGMAGDVHPINKLDVGHRLALNARALVYGESDLVYSGPIYESMAIEDNQIRLTFTHRGSGLASSTGDQLEGFAIAGEDGNFVWADATIEGDEVVVSNQSVPDPQFVLYGWDQNPIISLFNKEGLPASPFRTFGE